MSQAQTNYSTVYISLVASPERKMTMNVSLVGAVWCK